MTLPGRIISVLAAACEVGSACVSSAVARATRRVLLTAFLLVVALALLLGAMGLMIAALFIGLAPGLGAHWAAMIAAAASLAGFGVFLACALVVSKGR